MRVIGDWINQCNHYYHSCALPDWSTVIRSPFSSDETVSNAFNRLHDVYDLTWAEISLEVGIPTGTVWDIANGKPVPDKWKKQLYPSSYRDLFSMPVGELRRAIKNRSAAE